VRRIAFARGPHTKDAFVANNFPDFRRRRRRRHHNYRCSLQMYERLAFYGFVVDMFASPVPHCSLLYHCYDSFPWNFLLADDSHVLEVATEQHLPFLLPLPLVVAAKQRPQTLTIECPAGLKRTARTTLVKPINQSHKLERRA
jgi:hypothetical protein